MHCEEPSCLEVCPTGATVQDASGIVEVEKEKCIGCNYCKMACPYGARYMVEEWESYFPKGAPISDYEKYAEARFTEERGVGVNTKCDFCKERIPTGNLPACVKACPANARTFGDLDDPLSEIVQLVKQGRGYVLQPELGNEPKVYYLPPR
jgi:molybdopterin-containing oxidoreductase family iron-sulfur binding subunit